MPISNTQPFFWHEGSACHIVVGEPGIYEHRFGGPLELVVADFPDEQRPLHRVLTLDLTDPRLEIRVPSVRLLPLLYGFVFDGCELRYQILSDKEVQVLELSRTIRNTLSRCPWLFPDRNN